MGSSIDVRHGWAGVDRLWGKTPRAGVADPVHGGGGELAQSSASTLDLMV